MTWLGRRVILPYDERVAWKWGQLSILAAQRGRARPINDTWIAACCIVAELPLATLNVKDFEDFAAHDVLRVIGPDPPEPAPGTRPAASHQPHAAVTAVRRHHWLPLAGQRMPRIRKLDLGRKPVEAPQCVTTFKDCFGLDQCQARLYTVIARHAVLADRQRHDLELRIDGPRLGHLFEVSLLRSCRPDGPAPVNWVSGRLGVSGLGS